MSQIFKSLFDWYPSSYPHEERKLLKKLDLVILTYSCLTFFSKSLDATNVNNAYVSGMKEDLELYGNELNKLHIYYQTGYALGQIPSILLMSRPQIAKYILPTFELVYGVLTFLQSRATSADDLYLLRFFTALFESPVFGGIMLSLGHYYSGAKIENKPAELFVRTGTWYISTCVASLTSGYLQAFAFTTLNGVSGKEGWRWLFIVDACITIPIALLGFVIWPGLPESGKKFYFTDDEYEIILTRCKKFGIKKAGKLNIDVFKRSFTNWKFYVLVIGFTFNSFIWSPTSSLSLWMKAQNRFTVPQINIYPTGSSIVALISTYLATAVTSTVFSLKTVYKISLSGPIFLYFTMTFRHFFNSDRLIFAGYYFSAVIFISSPTMHSFANTALKDDAEVKAVTMGSMMAVSQLVNPLLQLWIFPVKNAPEWNVGWPLGFFISILAILTFNLGNRWFDQEVKDRGFIEYDTDSDSGDILISDVESVELTKTPVKIYTS